MADLVPLKMKIGLKENGHAKHPAFNSIPDAARGNMDWSHYVDRYGSRMHYDKQCGHDDDDVGSPRGVQFAVMGVPQAFATEALKLFGPTGTAEPGIVEEIAEADFEAFYNDRAHAHEDSERVDTAVLQAIKAKQDLSLALTKEQQDALDPAKPQPGLRPNTNKTWAGFKAKRGLTVVSRLAKAVAPE